MLMQDQTLAPALAHVTCLFVGSEQIWRMHILVICINIHIACELPLALIINDILCRARCA